MSRRRLLATLGVLGLLLSAGCADVTVRATVGGDGTVDRYEVTVETTAQIEEILNESGGSEGPDSLLERARTNVSRNLGVDPGAVEATRRQRGENVTLRLVARDVDPDSGSGADAAVTVTRSDGRLVYRDRSVVSNGTQGNLGPDVGSFEVNYTVVMPTEVRDSNADSVEGRRANYRFSAEDPRREPVRVESPAPGGPGPAVLVGGALAAGAVLAVAVLLWRRRRA